MAMTAGDGDDYGDDDGDDHDDDDYDDVGDGDGGGYVDDGDDGRMPMTMTMDGDDDDGDDAADDDASTGWSEEKQMHSGKEARGISLR